MMTSRSLLSYLPTGDYYTKKENIRRIGRNGNSCLFKSNTPIYGSALSHKNGGLCGTVGFRLNFGLSAKLVRTAPRTSSSTTTTATARAYPPIGKNGYVLPAKWKKVDVHKQGFITDDGGYQQTFVIRACEIGPDKAATMETILSLLQETSLNHILLLGLVVDGFGGTHGMKSHNLAWVISRVEVEVDRYPGWGEVIEIETWIAATGRNGMRRDWVLRDLASGVVFAIATSTMVAMNKQTRRVSKLPEEVREELSTFFCEKQVLKKKLTERIERLTDKAKYVTSDLKPMWSDLDVNYHVNNVKYVKWILETVPEGFLRDHQISSIILEYKRECTSCDIVQSLCEPQEDGIPGCINGAPAPFKYTHLLQIQGDTKNADVVRARTLWKRKMSAIPFST